MVSAATPSVQRDVFAEKASSLYKDRKIGYLLSTLKKDGRESFFLGKIQTLEQLKNSGELEEFDFLFDEINNEIRNKKKTTIQTLFETGGTDSQAPAFTKTYDTHIEPEIFQLSTAGELERKTIRERLAERYFNKGYYQYLSGIGPVGIFEKLNGRILSRLSDRQFDALKGHWISAYV
jgi:hypothetical protein